MDATFERLLGRYTQEYGEVGERRLLAVTSPGRTELCGNHTDHEGGHVVAGAIDRAVHGIFSANGTGVAHVSSVGFDPVEVDLTNLDPREDEHSTTAALVRGMAAGFAGAGFSVGGFDAVLESDVLAGSGLSSSAAFELALGVAGNALWAGGAVAPFELARMAQADENVFFGKPCGLMDQASVALGGIQHMSFRDPGAPTAERVDFDFSEAGYAICLVDVGSDHANLTPEYAAVPGEMRSVAAAFGATRLCEVDERDFLARMPGLRTQLGDRAVLRAVHYWREERLVEERARALAAHDMGAFLSLERLSGASSAMYLQNVSVAGSVAEQSAMVALALADELLGPNGCCRIHGGGFGGTIQAFVPLSATESFASGMDAVFGAGHAAVYSIDQEGARSAWM